ncbi:hypothetical protein FS837_007277 [Tulasnella sp. UAMH 9824]|nr:hypothetical protein FS837_007277 [Tulasnella sp. UAMH 9824]
MEFRQISRDTHYYTDPSTFRPERFLKKDEEQSRFIPNPDVLSPWDWAFGFGRRVCPGRDLAMQGVWISATFVLWGFEIKPKPGRTMADGYMATDEERFNFGVSASAKVKQMINLAIEEEMKAGGL